MSYSCNKHVHEEQLSVPCGQKLFLASFLAAQSGTGRSSSFSHPQLFPILNLETVQGYICVLQLHLGLCAALSWIQGTLTTLGVITVMNQPPISLLIWLSKKPYTHSYSLWLYLFAVVGHQTLPPEIQLDSSPQKPSFRQIISICCGIPASCILP